MPYSESFLALPANAHVQGESAEPSGNRAGLFRRRVLPLLGAARSALTAFRLLPVFTPRATLDRWRSQRAIRAAANDARRAVATRSARHPFRLNGLTWHQLYIAQDLRRVALFLRHVHVGLERGDIAAADVLFPLERSFAYLLTNVWQVYNVLERDVLFPWIAGGSRQPAVSKALLVFSKERERIADAANVAHERLARLVCTAGYGYTSAGPCSSKSTFRSIRNASVKRRTKHKYKSSATRNAKSEQETKEVRERKELTLRETYKPVEREQGRMGRKLTKTALNPDDVKQLMTEIANITADCESLCNTKSSVLYPLVANTFSPKEQGKLTSTLVYSMRSVLAKFTIAIYHQAVEKEASRLHWMHYKREVPLPIRVYTPVWRARLYDESPLGWLRCTELTPFSNKHL